MGSQISSVVQARNTLLHSVLLQTDLSRPRGWKTKKACRDSSHDRIFFTGCDYRTHWTTKSSEVGSWTSISYDSSMHVATDDEMASSSLMVNVSSIYKTMCEITLPPSMVKTWEPFLTDNKSSPCGTVVSTYRYCFVIWTLRRQKQMLQRGLSFQKHHATLILGVHLEIELCLEFSRCHHDTFEWRWQVCRLCHVLKFHDLCDINRLQFELLWV